MWTLFSMDIQEKKRHLRSVLSFQMAEASKAGKAPRNWISYAEAAECSPVVDHFQEIASFSSFNTMFLKAVNKRMNSSSSVSELIYFRFLIQLMFCNSL
jgi:hypothetical protein